MPDPGSSRARWALLPLLVSDALLFVRVAPGADPDATQVALGFSTLAVALSALDLGLGAGIFSRGRWARELARYRCWLGAAFLGFAWLIYLMALPSTSATGVRAAEVLAMTRDGVVLALYAAAWVLLRPPPPALPGSPSP